VASNSVSPTLLTQAGSQPHKIAELPWLDYATAAMPNDHNTILWWAQYLWMSNDTFRQALSRVGQHFITDLSFPDLEPDEESELKEFFTQHLDYRVELAQAADNFLGYGNVFISLFLPFRRFLRCRGCSSMHQIGRVPYKLTLRATAPYVIWQRRQACPVCGNNDAFTCVDLKDPDLSRVKLVFYSPFEIEMAYNRVSRRKEFWWKIPEDDRRDILSGAPIFVETTPADVLEAVARNGNVAFDDGNMLHLAENVLSGIKNRGWGIPRTIASFRTAWLHQVTNKADQAIAMDYTLGMRIMSPAQTAGGVDPMQSHALENFASKMQSMINAHRVDPTRYHTAPYPINYQFMGGEGATLILADKLKFRQQEFLNGLGVPLEYHQMSLQVQAAPMALRLFEASWQIIPTLYGKILDWTKDKLVKNYSLKPTKIILQRTTIADDMTRKQVLTQLMAGNQISPQTALEVYGVDARDEVQKVFKHQDYVAKVQREYEEKNQAQQEMGATQALTGMPTPSSMANNMQAQAQQGAPPPGTPMGGVPSSGASLAGGQSSNTLTGMSQQAEQMAQQLVSMPEYERKQQLRGIRESNKDMHALVTAAMDKIRRGAASQGQQMLLQQPPAGG
jgi:hypothetical protein